MRITVNDGWQLGDDAGKTYQPGESFDAPKELAEQWVAAGMAVKVKAEKAVQSSKNKAVTAPQVENKSEVKK